MYYDALYASVVFSAISLAAVRDPAGGLHGDAFMWLLWHHEPAA
jgi:hypothetical protein